MKCSASISPALVKELREKTGAGMMDCKKALSETSGNLEEAVDWLRKKGLAAASKKAGRVASEGLVAIASASPSQAAMIEVNSETDFVARNPQFQEFALHLAQVASKGSLSIDELAQKPYKGGQSIIEELTQLIATIGENIQLRRVTHFEVEPGVVACYMHSAVAPNLGKIGVLLAIESSAPQQALLELGKKLAMHIAAANPIACHVESVDPALVEREKAVLMEQAQASGRPPDVVAKMVEGRIRKFYEEVVFLEQTYVIDGKTQITQVVEQAAKDLGHSIQILGFSRFSLGEGIEKQTKDFASEVAAQVKS
jgi:elongation factor Ts